MNLAWQSGLVLLHRHLCSPVALHSGEHRLCCLRLTGPIEGPRRREQGWFVGAYFVDDHALFREGLAGLFAYQDDFVIVGEASDADTAILKVAEVHPDIVLMDIDMPGEDGIATTRRIKSEQLAFVACEGNAKLVVMDLQTMSVTESNDVGSVPDVLAFDAPRRVLYVAAESGPATAFEETDTGLKPLAQKDVGPNAHSMAVDPDTGHAYFPLANLGGQPVLREVSIMTATGDDDQ